jgi:23S rRNA (pseudouridine1915-N3)-methyltransferase
VRISIAAIGRLKAGGERDLCDRYLKRAQAAGRQAGIGAVEEIELPESVRGGKSEKQREEAAALIGKAGAEATLIALDETGKTMDSRAFAKMIAAYRDDGVRHILFAIGGAEGHGPQIDERAARKLSLGPMTLPHGLARVVLAEQIYRAITILTGHPYHRG